MQAEPVKLTLNHERFVEFLFSLADEGATARTVCKVVQKPEKWSSEFCEFLCGTNVRTPKMCEDIHSYLADVAWCDARKCVADSAEGPPKTWNEYEFMPLSKQRPENIVADFTDWMCDMPEEGSHWPIKLCGPDDEVVYAVAIAHPETRYGRQIVVFEVEPAR